MISNRIRRTAVALLLTFGMGSPLTAMAQAYPGFGGQQAPHIQQQQATQGIVVNGVALTPQQMAQLGVQPGQVQPGRYWYDAQTGAWGMEGAGVQGFTQPGLRVGGALKANASNGRTGVFINGRQLPQSDLMKLQQAVGQQVPQGRYWCRANGDCGQEGNPQPLVNLLKGAGGGNHVTGVPGSRRGGHYSVDGKVGGCFEGSGGKMVCWDEDLGSSSY